MMGDKNLLNEDPTVNIPLQYSVDGAPKTDEGPPAYEHPEIDFTSGWKDRGFAIAFWIHTAAVIILGSVLGIPVVVHLIKNIPFNELGQRAPKFDFKPFLYGLGAAAGVGSLSSFLTFFLLQLCAGGIIRCSFLVIIMFQISLGVGLYFIFWPLCIIPGFFLLITLICLTCIRKRIPFAEAHLQAGFAALRSHPSLILIALVMIVVQFLWFVFWFLMVLGIQNVSNKSALSFNINKTNMTDTTTFNLTSKQSTSIIPTAYMITRKSKQINNTQYFMNKESKSINSTKNSLDRLLERMNRTDNSTSSEETRFSRYFHYIIGFCLLFSWYWGATTFGNICHFTTACTVGQWWFTDDANQQYAVRTSLKRALTTNFGTICFGSFFEALIKTLRRSAENKRRQNILSCLLLCILQAIEKIVGYLNEWAFIYSALTGQSYVQAGKSFIELFQKRGWTAIINDAVVGTTLFIINILIGLISAAAGGIIIYVLMPKSPEQIIATVIITIISFLIGILMSSLITTIIISCVRTVFVCFALNPAVLGATHPDHLQRLTKVWNKFYPQEFAASGYTHNLAGQIA